MTDGKLHHRSPDLTGLQFGSLTASRPAHSDGKKRHWVYLCACGTECVKVATDVNKAVRQGRAPCCGCTVNARISEKRTRHGMTGHPAYWVYRSMVDRCRLPTHQAWRNYGGRGIRVCTRWSEIFENFWEDMGPTYRRGLEIDRRDNDGPYSPENCRWVPCRTQSNNKRDTLMVKLPWGELPLTLAAEFLNVKESTLRYRAEHNWPMGKLGLPADSRQRVAKSST